MKVKQRSGIPLPVFNRKKKDTGDEGDNDQSNKPTTTTTTKLPTIPAPPSGVKLCGSARRKIVARSKTVSAERAERATILPSPITITEPKPTDTGKVILSTTNAGNVATSQRYTVPRKLSMGALQQERVNLVMGREELAKEWLENEQEKRRLEIKLLHINLYMTTVENEITAMSKREHELRCEVEKR